MSPDPNPDFRPLLCADLELTAPVAPTEIPDDAGLELLVRVQGDPVGTLIVEPSGTSSGIESWCTQARQQFDNAITHHDQPLDAIGSWPRAVVSISTIGKHPLLPTAIRALLDQDYAGEFEIVVVDNAPANGLTPPIVESIGDSRITLVTEQIPGISAARNAAYRYALDSGADIIAFTDDDALADPGWLRNIGAVFAQDRAVGVVTGLVVPGSQMTRAEQLFEEGSGFNKGYVLTVWSTAPDTSGVWALGVKGDGGGMFPWAAGSFGSGNNMAFRVTDMKRIGSFDISLGAGTAAPGGDDLDAFVRFIVGGTTLIYEPRAIVRHFHRDSFDALEKQMFGYGAGLSAYLVREFLALPGAKGPMLKGVFRGVRHMFASDSEKNSSRTGTYPKELARAELKGLMQGPWLYLKSRRQTKKRTSGRV